jgi:nitrous oxidase accessory protein NosD
MLKSVTLLLTVLLVMAFASEFLPSKAQSNIIVIPDDFPTLTKAVENATDGTTIYVRSGTYEEPANQTLTVNKTISIIGQNANDTIINFHPKWVFQGWEEWGDPIFGYECSFKIQANQVTISGLTIASDGGYMLLNGNEIQIISNNLKAGTRFAGSFQTVQNNVIAAAVSIEGTNIVVAQNFLQSSIGCSGDCIVTKNTIVGNGITITGGNARKVVYDNLVINGSGIHAAGSDNSLVFNNTVINGSGIGVSGHGSGNVFYANRIINGTVGILATTRESDNLFYANYVRGTSVGIYASYAMPLGNNNTFYLNNFIDNSKQVFNDPTIKSQKGIVPPTDYKAYTGGVFDNGSVGNYWSDYAGKDSNGDGLGDTPYIIDASRKDNHPLIAPFDIDSISIEVPTWVNITSPEPPKFNPPSDSPSPSDNLGIDNTLTWALIVATVIGVAAIVIIYLTKHRH